MNFLDNILEWVWDLLPHMELIPVTHRGIKFLPGGRTKVCGPGLVWHWPVTTDLVTVPVVRQLLEVTPLNIATKDDIQVLVDGVVVYTVSDVEKNLALNFESEDLADDLAQAAIRRVVMSSTWERLNSTRSHRHVESSLLEEVSEALTPLGIQVEEVRIADLAKHRVLSLKQ